MGEKAFGSHPDVGCRALHPDVWLDSRTVNFIPIDLVVPDHLTDSWCRVVSTPASYSRAPGFDFPPEGWLSWLWVFVAFLSHSRSMLGCYLTTNHDSFFHAHPNLLFIIILITLCRLSAVEKVSLKVTVSWDVAPCVVWLKFTDVSLPPSSGRWRWRQ
jgi:hypothetical protein